MTVRELIDRLEEMNQDATVMIAYQPRYPLCNKADENVVMSEENSMVYIGEEKCSSNDYLSGDIQEEFGW